MEDKFFDIDEAMIDYSEMTGFDFSSGSYQIVSAQRYDLKDYSHQPFTFKYGNYDVLDLLKTMFSKTDTQKV